MCYQVSCLKGKLEPTPLEIQGLLNRLRVILPEWGGSRGICIPTPISHWLKSINSQALPASHAGGQNRPQQAEKSLRQREAGPGRGMWASVPWSGTNQGGVGGCWQHLLHHPALVTSAWGTHGDIPAKIVYILLALVQTRGCRTSSSLQSLPMIIPRRTQGVSHMHSQTSPVSRASTGHCHLCWYQLILNPTSAAFSVGPQQRHREHQTCSAS